MKKYFFYIVACLFTTVVVADNVAIYDPESEIPTVEIPELIIEGQEGEYYIEMQQTEEEGFTFKVTLAEKDADGAEDSDDLRATFYPTTGIVEIPLVAVYSSKDNEPLKTYSVKMLKEDRDGYFFTVTAANPAEAKLSQKLLKNKIALKRRTVVKCESPYKIWAGKVRKPTHYFSRNCPEGWAETN